MKIPKKTSKVIWNNRIDNDDVSVVEYNTFGIVRYLVEHTSKNSWRKIPIYNEFIDNKNTALQIAETIWNTVVKKSIVTR